MQWNYICPNCQKWHRVDWINRSNTFVCPNTQKNHIPPTPSQQVSAYVDTHEWPVEMENVVISLKGTNCTVPGCKKTYQTLDHRIPYAKGGKTSTENLFPMCDDHNQSKSDTDYSTWLLTKPK